MSQLPHVLLCTGFHRSATSVTAQMLQGGGMYLGDKLLPPHISNIDGHFEDAEAVSMHDAWLSKNSTDWQYHNEVTLGVDKSDMSALAEYVSYRDTSLDMSSYKGWAVKDPRMSLFLPVWKKVLGERTKVLVVLRHWAACCESLHTRHSREIAYQTAWGNSPVHSNFWLQPNLAARMWLAYCAHLLSYIKNNRDKVVVVTQSSIFSNAPFINLLNERFSLSLGTNGPSPIKPGLMNEKASALIDENLTPALREQLNAMWLALLELADFKSDKEEIQWYSPVITNENLGYSNSGLLTLETKISDSHATTITLNQLLSSKESNYSEVFDSIENSPEVKSWLKKNLKRMLSVIATESAALHAFGQLLLKNDLINEAEIALTKAASLPHPKPFIYLSLAKIAKQKEQILLAVTYIDYAIKRNPNNPAFHLFRSELISNSAERVAYLERVFETLPNQHIAVAIIRLYFDIDAKKAEALCKEHQNKINPAVYEMLLLQAKLLNKDKSANTHYLKDIAKRISEKPSIDISVMYNASYLAARDLNARIEAHIDTLLTVSGK